MVTIEIYWDDLKKETQDEILDLLNMEPGENNWDVFPIATVSIVEKLDKEETV